MGAYAPICLSASIMVCPDRKIFFQQVAQGNNFIPVTHNWPADLDTPLTTWLKIDKQTSPGVLLESVEGGERMGRWSFIVTEPLWTFTVRGDQVHQHLRDGDHHHVSEGNPLEILINSLSQYKPAPLPGLPPLGQLFGFWGYELISWIESTVPIHPRYSDDPPDGCWLFADSLIIFDQVKRQITVVVYADISNGQDPETAFNTAQNRIEKLRGELESPLPPTTPLKWQTSQSISIKTRGTSTQENFEVAVKKIREHISAGDIFQLVLSQKLECDFYRDPFELYRSLRMVNPSPYMAFFNFGNWYLIGSSPEVMVKAEPKSDGIQASLRPIAGTRARGNSESEDEILESNLLADPKERAEHVMLVDLGRNDLGRVCSPGSVKVANLMMLERYSHVMHIVSQIYGQLDSSHNIWDLLVACFPAGTVSGAPKIRAMKLIHDFEPGARGPYSGVYGSIDLLGALNTAITIRTIVVLPHERKGWRVQIQAGAGIVADSEPRAEYLETVNKARGLFKALACLVNT
uniref:Anthranilate synthase component 1 n=1 Tax=Paulinella chromatophora TaxID=39717 RepID=B1X521_PAUCH|nr:Anthranilate synthase [Paulinella chromatophora]ACB43040.1 Anthranilate synthase [Paulinella chromatophora]